MASRAARLADRASHLRLPELGLIALAIAATYFLPAVGVLFLLGAALGGLALAGRSALAVPAAYLLAAFLVPGELGGSTTAAVLVSVIAIPVLLAGWVDPNTYGGPMPRAHVVLTSLDKAVIVLWATWTLSWSFGALEPLSGFVRRAGDSRVLILVGATAIALLTSHATTSVSQLRRLFAALVIGASAMAVIATLQTIANYDLVEAIRLPGFTESTKELGYRVGLVRGRGTARHAIEQGCVAVAVLPIALHLATYALTRAARIAAAVASVVLVVGALVSLSRSPYVLLIVTLVLLVPTWGKQRRFALAVGGLALAFSVLYFVPDIFDAVIEVASDPTGERVASDIEYRTSDYPLIRAIVLDHPILGVGYGNFHPLTYFTVDNQFLSTVAATGLLGLLALFGVILTSLAGALRARRLAAGDRAARDLAWALFVAMLTTSASFFFYDTLSFPVARATFFFLVGAISALLAVGSTAASADEPGAPDTTLVSSGR